VPFEGGVVRQITNGQASPAGDEEGNWSPDGRSLVFSAPGGASLPGHPGYPPLEMLTLKTGQVKELPNSEGLWSVRWSPDGRLMSGLGQPQSFLWLYDPATHKRHQLTTITAGWPSWSRDSRWVIFQNNLFSYRVRVSDGKLERLGARNHLKGADWTLGWIGVTPDGALISTRDAGSTEIYALDWESAQ
jgi:Tol biopolymer transport system component